MAELGAELWKYNLARILVIDVTDDYRSMRPPLPSECYQVLREVWMPAYLLLIGGTRFRASANREGVAPAKPRNASEESISQTTVSLAWLNKIQPEGYLYDWHESPTEAHGTWYVGVVHSGLLAHEGHG